MEPGDGFIPRKGAAATDDPCLFELANDPETIPTFDELRLQLIADAAERPDPCSYFPNAYRARFCASRNILSLDFANGFSSKSYYFDGDTRTLIAISFSVEEGADPCAGQFDYIDDDVACDGDAYVDIESLCPALPL